MASVRPSFIRNCQTQITQTLVVADAWSALKAEYDTFTANGITITDADVEAMIPGLTAAQFNAALGAQQEVVDHVHIATRAAKLYRVLR